MTIFSYMITVWDILLWIFRIIVAVCYSSGIEFILEPLNLTIEILIIFATIPCLIFVLKRNIIGAACYLAIYVSYFGTVIYNTFNNIDSEEGLTASGSLEIVVSIIGIVIPILTFLDVWLNKHRKSIVGGNKSTDWYYKNDEYDRKYDERADKNQYKIR